MTAGEVREPAPGARRFWQVGRFEGWCRTDGQAGDVLHCAGPADNSPEFRRSESPAERVKCAELCGWCYLQVGHTETAHRVTATATAFSAALTLSDSGQL